MLLHGAAKPGLRYFAAPPGVTPLENVPGTRFALISMRKDA